MLRLGSGLVSSLISGYFVSTRAHCSSTELRILSSTSARVKKLILTWRSHCGITGSKEHKAGSDWFRLARVPTEGNLKLLEGWD